MQQGDGERPVPVTGFIVDHDVVMTVLGYRQIARLPDASTQSQFDFTVIGHGHFADRVASAVEHGAVFFLAFSSYAAGHDGGFHDVFRDDRRQFRVDWFAFAIVFCHDLDEQFAFVTVGGRKDGEKYFSGFRVEVASDVDVFFAEASRMAGVEGGGYISNRGECTTDFDGGDAGIGKHLGDIDAVEVDHSGFFGETSTGSERHLGFTGFVSGHFHVTKGDIGWQQLNAAIAEGNTAIDGVKQNAFARFSNKRATHSEFLKFMGV
ncbi:hypothetical protein D9M70_402090 [compost metagenome]